MNNDPLTLAWELSVLERSVKFPNLSVAAQHIGLSQPQISRTIQKIEAELEITLLDRSSKRQSHWTPEALKIAEEFQNTRRDFRSMLFKNFHKNEVFDVKLGCLEGLSDVASKFARSIFKNKISHQVEIHVYDLNELSEKFHAGELDIILSSRTIGGNITKHILGYQILSYTGDPSHPLHILSPSEKALSLHSHKKPKAPATRLISNSLAIRKSWMDTPEAYGSVPSKLFKEKVKSEKNAICEPVLMIGSEKLPPKLKDFMFHFDPFRN